MGSTAILNNLENRIVTEYDRPRMLGDYPMVWDFEELGPIIAVNIIMGVPSTFLFFAQLFIGQKQIDQLIPVVRKKYTTSREMYNLFYNFPFLLRNGALLKAIFSWRNRCLLLLVVLLTAVVVIPVYFWPLLTGGVSLGEFTLAATKYCLRPLSIVIHIFNNSYLL